MPIVQPDYRGDTRVLSVNLASDLLLQTIAYAAQCRATLDNVVAVALDRLLEADKAEREAWLKEHPEAIEPARLKHYARGRNHRRGGRLKPAPTSAGAPRTAASAVPARLRDSA
jgi:hypothetical protein